MRLSRSLVLPVLAALVLAACGSETGTPAPRDQGVRGIVVLGPTCPVMTQDSPCPGEPLPGVTVTVAQGGDPLDVTAISNASGRFELPLPPGEYTIEAIVPEPGPGRSARPVRVQVPPETFVEVVVTVDTGIR